MEILAPSSYFSNPSWFLDESITKRKWSAAENKAFENALAVFDENTPNRWERVAERVPGKSVADVIRQYKELEDDVTSIEAGLVPFPGYTNSSSSSSSPFTLEWGSSHGFDGFKHSFSVGGKKPPPGSTRPNEHERKKGVPWTEEEHKLFLLGLKKYGKGDWRNISRNYVITRTPTQVASHAQKYFIRQLSGGKDKRRASIHDITTVSLHDNQNPSPDSKKTLSTDHQPLAKQSNTTAIDKLSYQWNQTSNETIMGFDAGTIFGNNAYGMNSYEVKMQGVHDLVFGSQNMVFPMQSGFQYNA